MVSFDLIVEPSDQVKKKDVADDALSVDVRSVTPTMKAITFPKDAASAHPANHFEDCCDDVYGTIGEAIREWTSKPFFTPFTSRCRK